MSCTFTVCLLHTLPHYRRYHMPAPSISQSSPFVYLFGVLSYAIVALVLRICNRHGMACLNISNLHADLHIYLTQHIHTRTHTNSSSRVKRISPHIRHGSGALCWFSFSIHFHLLFTFIFVAVNSHL